MPWTQKAPFPDDVFSDPENRFALVATPEVISIVFRRLYRGGLSSLFVADEELPPMYMGYWMHVSLKDIISLKGSQFVESGYYYREAKSDYIEDFKTKQEDIGPQVLTLRHLSAGFVVICGCLFLSSIVFVAECAPKVLEMCLRCYIVIKFVRMKKML
jgi:hypothetical protein